MLRNATYSVILITDTVHKLESEQAVAAAATATDKCLFA